MADKDTGGDEPSLELPSLFGGKRKKKNERSSAPVAAPSDAPADSGDAGTSGDSEPTQTVPVTQDAPQAPAAAAPQPATPPPASRPVSHRAPAPQVEHPTQEIERPPAPSQGEETSRRKPPSIPSFAASTAALLVGSVVGLLGVVLTFLGLKGCEVVTGTDSCGGPGLLVLFAIVVVMVLVGAALLKLLRVPDAGNVSFLGVGIMAVLVMMFLVSYLDRPLMLVVIPALTAASYAVARWVASRLVEDVFAE